MRLQFESEHHLGEGGRIDPWQGPPADGDLILDDGAAGFERARVAGAAQCVDERRLAGAGSAGDDDEAIGVGIIYRT
jgi:hypothetical protein